MSQHFCRPLLVISRWFAENGKDLQRTCTPGVLVAFVVVVCLRFPKAKLMDLLVYSTGCISFSLLMSGTGFRQMNHSILVRFNCRFSWLQILLGSLRAFFNVHFEIIFHSIRYVMLLSTDLARKMYDLKIACKFKWKLYVF